MHVVKADNCVPKERSQRAAQLREFFRVVPGLFDVAPQIQLALFINMLLRPITKRARILLRACQIALRQLDIGYAIRQPSGQRRVQRAQLPRPYSGGQQESLFDRSCRLLFLPGVLRSPLGKRLTFDTIDIHADGAPKGFVRLFFTRNHFVF